ncbi:hypothetical protein EV199_3028 [Pseudobacter ginsenosidimutans]|uniref:Uncharacterized protein n=1 Tax=Pseudobacter ginsenosidimutans TaxID=661488 RepID=A0A4Q7MRB5_9BACT|nr:hypothetical protein EV199_3028 [Pseudobacter ginsenosidimutans]
MSFALMPKNMCQIFLGQIKGFQLFPDQVFTFFNKPFQPQQSSLPARFH